MTDMVGYQGQPIPVDVGHLYQATLAPGLPSSQAEIFFLNLLP